MILDYAIASICLTYNLFVFLLLHFYVHICLNLKGLATCISQFLQPLKFDTFQLVQNIYWETMWKLHLDNPMHNLDSLDNKSLNLHNKNLTLYNHILNLHIQLLNLHKQLLNLNNQVLNLPQIQILFLPLLNLKRIVDPKTPRQPNHYWFVEAIGKFNIFVFDFIS